MVDRKVALVTGASRGIGEGITKAMREQGIAVAGISCSNEAVQADRWLKCDVANAGEVEGAVTAVLQHFGKIDILINCAGIAQHATLTETSDELWNRTMAINVTGAFLMMRAAMPSMIERGWGRIVNVASAAAKRGEPQMAAYAASKHALVGLTRSAALQVAKAGVTVNAICPGGVPTNLLESGFREWAQQTGRTVEVARRIFQSFTPQNRLFEISEVATLVRFLISEEAHGINGQAINLCGGALAV